MFVVSSSASFLSLNLKDFFLRKEQNFRVAFAFTRHIHVFFFLFSKISFLLSRVEGLLVGDFEILFSCLFPRNFQLFTEYM